MESHGFSIRHASSYIGKILAFISLYLTLLNSEKLKEYKYWYKISYTKHIAAFDLVTSNLDDLKGYKENGKILPNL